jgi:transcriptional regulator with XRE-family HTH domain
VSTVDNDPGPVVQRALLKNELVRLRREAGVTQATVAAKLGWSEAKVIRVEGGKAAPNKNDLDGLLKAYGVTSQDRLDRLIELSQASKRTAWWDVYRGEGINDEVIKYIGYEYGAASLRHSQNSRVPALLQTPDYAEVVTKESTPRHLVKRVVDLRLQRRKELEKRQESQRPEEIYVLDEAVIRRHIGVTRNPMIMVEQLHRLLEFGRRDNINIHVVPFKSGSHFGMYEPFTIMGFEALEDVLYFDVAGRGNVIEAGDVIMDYADRFLSTLEGDEEKRPEALNIEDSRELIKEAAKEMSTVR